jgi:hypothetical protein
MRTEHDFALYAEAQLRPILDLLIKKGLEYGADKEALSNFLEGAVALSETPQAYLMNLANKQHYVICQWATGHRSDMTPKQIQERAKDIVIYMLLLSFMIDDLKQDGPPTGSRSPVYYEPGKVPFFSPDKMDPFGELYGPVDTTDLDVHISESGLIIEHAMEGASELSLLHRAANKVPGDEGIDDIKGIFFDDDGTPHPRTNE